MSTLDWIILPLLVFCAYVLLAEVRLWLRKRRDGGRRARSAAIRLLRRALGVVAIIIILVLLRYPWLDETPILIRIARLTAALGLCFALFLLAAWDYLAVRHEIRTELREFGDKTVRDLRSTLREAAEQARKKNPKKGPGPASAKPGK